MGLERTNSHRWESAMNNPVDIVKEMMLEANTGPGQLWTHHDLVDGNFVQADKGYFLQQWLAEVERLQVLPEQIKQLADKWSNEYGFNALSSDAYPQWVIDIADNRCAELLALLTNNKGEHDE